VNIAVQFPFNFTHTLIDTICAGGTVRLSASGADEYNWMPGEGIVGNNVSTIVVKPLQSTVYRVIGRDKKHCFADTGFIPVKVYPIPVVEAGGIDQTINVGQSVTLTPVVSQDAHDIKWTPTTTIVSVNHPSVTVKPRETTTYTVTVRNNGGCTAKDDLTVYVICNGANVFIPNTFSPNSDGANDVFFPRGSGVFSIKSFKVFNRWGELMYSRNDFQANDSRSGWDGKYKGQIQNPDVFVYIMEVLCDNNTVLTYKGNVALIR
jgi:gliding motility-associated-like protein